MMSSTDGFTARTAELSSGRVHYREAGEGDPIVFVHGFAVNGRLWDGPAARLAETHRCIVPDWPLGSHREAMAPDADLSPPGVARIVAEFLDSLDLEQVTLVGNDSGGAVCQIVVTEHAARVGRLVLTNCDCLEIFPPGSFKLLVKVLKVPGAATLLAQGMRLDANRQSPLAYGALSKRRLGDELLDSWTRPQIEDRGVRRDSRKFGSSMDPRHTLAAAEKLPGLDIPVLLAWGEHDRFFTVEHAERLQALIPGARLIRFEDSLTFVPIDEPDRLAAEISSFVAETTGAGTAAAGRLGA